MWHLNRVHLEKMKAEMGEKHVQMYVQQMSSGAGMKAILGFYRAARRKEQKKKKKKQATVNEKCCSLERIN